MNPPKTIWQRVWDAVSFLIGMLILIWMGYCVLEHIPAPGGRSPLWAGGMAVYLIIRGWLGLSAK